MQLECAATAAADGEVNSDDMHEDDDAHVDDIVVEEVLMAIVTFSF